MTGWKSSCQENLSSSLQSSHQGAPGAGGCSVPLTQKKGNSREHLPLSLVNTSSLDSSPAGIRHSRILHRRCCNALGGTKALREWAAVTTHCRTAASRCRKLCFSFCKHGLIPAKGVRRCYKHLQSNWTQSGGDLEYPPGSSLEKLSCAKTSSYINDLFIKHVHTHRGPTCCSPRAATPPCP